MVKSIFKLFLPTLFLIFIACEDDSPTAADDPANLSVEVTVAEDKSGQVDLTATAQNTVEYHFYMGDGQSTEPIINTTGEISYTYEASGVYLIETRAYGKSGKFLKKETQVSVIVEGSNPDDGYTTPPAYDGMTLIWSDEFNGSALDETNWTYEIGDGCPNLCGWGNAELQYYRRENTTVANGYLTIQAKSESFQGRAYTSSRIKTENKFSFKYGRVDIRARLPKDQGLWPALWMLGSNIREVSWPACGEIDIMELVGGPNSDNKVHSTIHWDNNGTKADYGLSYTLDEGIFNDKFHVFSMIWDANQIKCFVDDQEPFFTVDITPAALSEFQNNFFFIFNVAVGGRWPGSPDGTTSFPQEMVVDYVRVFQPN